VRVVPAPHPLTLTRFRFDQFVSTRFTFPSSPLTPAWPTLPFDGVQQVPLPPSCPTRSHVSQALTLRTAGVDAVAALSPSALLIWASGRWIDVNTLGASLAVSSGCRACEGAHDGHDGVFVACGSGVDFLRCDWSSAAPASCSSTQLLVLPLRPLTSAVALGGSLFLSPATGGLLRIDFSAPTPRLYLEPACDPHPGLPPYGDLSALAAYGLCLCVISSPLVTRYLISLRSAIHRRSRTGQLHRHLPNIRVAAHHRDAASARAPR
jgi:hypothetical protein